MFSMMEEDHVQYGAPMLSPFVARLWFMIFIEMHEAMEAYYYTQSDISHMERLFRVQKIC